MGEVRSLYEEDFVRWADEQAEAIRAAASAGANLPLDWENLAEEVESLGKSERSELRSRVANVIEHLLKLQHSPAVEPRRGWADTVSRERRDLEFLLEASPSLRADLQAVVDRVHPSSAKFALAALAEYGEAPPDRRRALLEQRYTPDQILGDWFPGDAQRGPDGG
jgi:hypothetical protein